MFEGDCEILVNTVNNISNDIAIDGLCRDIQFWKTKFRDICFTYANRLSNRVAHLLAKNGCLDVNYFSGCITLPIWLAEQLYFDRINSI